MSNREAELNYREARWLARELRAYIRRNFREAPALSTTEHVSRYLHQVFVRISERVRGEVDGAPETKVARFGAEELRLIHAAVLAGRDREPFVVTYKSSLGCSRNAMLSSISEQFDRIPRYLDAFLDHPSSQWVDQDGYEDFMSRQYRDQEGW